MLRRWTVGPWMFVLMVPSLASAQVFEEPAVAYGGADIAEPFLPYSGVGRVVLEASVGCNHGDLVGGATTVRFDVINPYEDVSRVFLFPTKDTRVFDEVRCVEDPDYRERFETEVVVFVTGDAPAYVPLILHVPLTVIKPHPVDGHQSFGPYDAIVGFRADYDPEVRYEIMPYHIKSPPNRDVTFLVRATNLGNAQTRIVSTVTPQPGSEGMRLEGPGATSLDSHAELGLGAMVTKALSFHGVAAPTSGVYSFLVEFEAGSLQAPPLDSRNLSDVQVRLVSVEVEGGFGDAPGPGGLSFLVVAALGVLIRGRARRE